MTRYAMISFFAFVLAGCGGSSAGFNYGGLWHETQANDKCGATTSTTANPNAFINVLANGGGSFTIQVPSNSGGYCTIAFALDTSDGSLAGSLAATPGQTCDTWTVGRWFLSGNADGTLNSWLFAADPTNCPSVTAGPDGMENQDTFTR